MNLIYKEEAEPKDIRILLKKLLKKYDDTSLFSNIYILVKTETKHSLKHFSENNTYALALQEAIYSNNIKLLNLVILLILQISGNDKSFIGEIIEEHNLLMDVIDSEIDRVVIDELFRFDPFTETYNTASVYSSHENYYIGNDEVSMSSALSKAVCKGRADLVKLLLSKGAKLDFEDSEVGLPLHCGVESRNSEIVDLLLGETETSELQNSNCLHFINLGRQLDGYTALHVAVESNQVDNVEKLLRHGANPLQVDHDGTNSYDLALDLDFSPMIDMLNKAIQQLMLKYSAVPEQNVQQTIYANFGVEKLAVDLESANLNSPNDSHRFQSQRSPLELYSMFTTPLEVPPLIESNKDSDEKLQPAILNCSLEGG